MGAQAYTSRGQLRTVCPRAGGRGRRPIEARRRSYRASAVRLAVSPSFVDSCPSEPPAGPDSQRCRWASASSTERNRRTPRGAWRSVPNARESDEAAHAAASPSSADADLRGSGISATSRYRRTGTSAVLAQVEAEGPRQSLRVVTVAQPHRVALHPVQGLRGDDSDRQGAGGTRATSRSSKPARTGFRR
jgi:hypothetical protein